MNVRLIVLAAVVGATTLGSVASAQQGPLNPAIVQRGAQGSDRNIRNDLRRLEGVIDMLQRDRRDYGGHREQAVDLLLRARQQLEAALDYDRTHGHG